MSDWYQIENSYFTVQLTSAGAEMKRLFAKPWHRELLWIPQDQKSQSIWKRTAPVLFPIVGRLKQDTFKYQGQDYRLTQHGFARDQNFKCLACGTDNIEFFLNSTEETLKIYPFLFELHVQYVLEDKKLSVTYTVKNKDKNDIFFSIGAHPAFETFKSEEYCVTFEKKEKGFYRLNNGLVNWKQLFPMDSQTIPVNKKIFAEDALIFRDVKSRYIDLTDQRRHEIIRVHTSAPYFGLWGKESVPFVCLEPWHGVSDDEIHNQNIEEKQGIIKLNAGKSFTFTYAIEILSAAVT